jgi:hypothetical protein
MWRLFHFNFELKAIDEADSSDETIDATEADKADEAFDAKANEVEVVIITVVNIVIDANFISCICRCCFFLCLLWNVNHVIINHLI